MSTKIPYVEETLNPFCGCTKVSQGCLNCYAERMARRLKAMGQKKYQTVVDDSGHWTGTIAFEADIMEKALKWKKPKIIFLGSMGDFFHESMPALYWKCMFEIIAKCPQHIFLLLTKRPEIALQASVNVHLTEYFDLPNVWIGVTAENQEQANKRIPILLQIPAAKRFVSIEPMLEPINLTLDIDPLKWNGYNKLHSLSGMLKNSVRDSYQSTTLNKLDWVICGCESGPRKNRREMNIEWVRDIKNQCVASGVPFFFKQQYIGNKKILMPLLDNHIWNQYPDNK
jgi:protein gp37